MPQPLQDKIGFAEAPLRARTSDTVPREFYCHQVTTPVGKHYLDTKKCINTSNRSLIYPLFGGIHGMSSVNSPQPKSLGFVTYMRAPVYRCVVEDLPGLFNSTWCEM